jgi:hypothetical protein
MSAPITIDRIYAWIVTEPGGGHGIPWITIDGVAFRHGDIRRGDMISPLVGADLERMERLRGAALACLGAFSQVQLVEFSGRKVLETHTAPGRGKRS